VSDHDFPRLAPKYKFENFSYCQSNLIITKCVHKWIDRRIHVEQPTDDSVHLGAVGKVCRIKQREI